jgi:TonB family protein
VFASNDRRTIVVLAACLALAAPARAQPMSPAVPQVEPPRLIADPGVIYPEQALREHVTTTVSVLLLLDIDATGVVTSATVAEPGGHGFDEAAVEAAHRLSFEPATRDGRAVPARIAFRYAFVPPPPPPRASAPTQAPPAAASPVGEPVEEVFVHVAGPSSAVTTRTLEPTEIVHSPGTNGDALRALQNLPGVGLAPLFIGQLLVRGSDGADTNTFIDGTVTPIIYHFGALSSVVPSELVERVDFYPGNYSVAYGRGMGGVVDVHLRDPRKDRFHLMTQIDGIDSRATAEGPVAAGWTFLAAARRSWFNLYLSPILSVGGAGIGISPVYMDGQAMLQRAVGAGGSFRLTLLGSDDAIDVADSNRGQSIGNIDFHTRFWRAQASYEQSLAAGTRLKLLAAFGRDAVTTALGLNDSTVIEELLSARGEVSCRMTRWLTGDAGFDVIYAWYTLNLRLPPPAQAGVPSGGPGQLPINARSTGTLLLPAAYAQLDLAPWRGARLFPGLRADYDGTTRRWDVAPRFAFRQTLGHSFPQTTLKGGAGLFFQPPTILEADPTYGQVGLVSSRATQIDVGVERDVTRQIDATFDLFYKSLEDLVVAGSGNSGSGRAYGAEVMVRYNPDDHFFGWLAYTLSRSERRNAPGQPSYLFQYDQTNILAVLGSYRFPHGWQAGLRFRLVTGDPYTPLTTGAYNATVGFYQGVAAFPPFASRLATFTQLDARVDKQWTIAGLNVTTYFDIENVTNTTNPVAVSYNYDFTQSATVNGLPILPNFGVRVDWR